MKLGRLVGSVAIVAVSFGAAFLAYRGVSSIVRGVGFAADPELQDGGQPMLIVLGALQLFGVVIMLIGLRALIRASRPTRGARSQSPTESIRQRAGLDSKSTVSGAPHPAETR